MPRTTVSWKRENGRYETYSDEVDLKIDHMSGASGEACLAVAVKGSSVQQLKVANCGFESRPQSSPDPERLDTGTAGLTQI